MKFDWVFLKFIHLDVNQTSILIGLPCNLAGAIAWYYDKFPVNLAKFDSVLRKLIMRLVSDLIGYF